MSSSPPKTHEQVSYLVTGGLAGLSTFPIELALASISASAVPRLSHHLKVAVPRAAIRFWTFDQVKTQLTPYAAQTPGQASVSALIGGLSGASGGVAETFYESLAFKRQLPSLAVAANHGGKLFFCFGTYTFLSTSLSEELPPKPFWRCWVMGAIAGATGSGILGIVDGFRIKPLLTATAKGGLTIGTVIAVQVTSCADLLHYWNGDEA